MSTKENIMKAFAGESQANRKYLAFAKQAEKEGKPNLAKLFRATAEGETVHALKHFETAGQVKESQANLEEALAGETEEYTNMYPAFLKEAEAEGDKAAYRSFNLANEAEKVHAKLYQQALEQVKAGGDAAADTYYVCPVCGYVSAGEAPERCPICGAKGATFKKF